MYSELFFHSWIHCHMTARSLEPRQKELSKTQIQAFIFMMLSMAELVPCPECKAHAAVWVTSHPPTNIKTGDEAFAYTVAWHNDINKRNGKREYTVKEAEEALIEHLSGNLKDMARAEIKHRESDQAYIKLQEELKLLKNVANRTSNESIYVYAVIAALVAIVILLMLIALFVIVLKNNKHTVSQQFVVV